MTCCNSEIVTAVRNYPPGLSALVNRRSIYSQFLQRMLAQLSIIQPDETQPGLRPLAALTTRDPQDPAIALLDSWAIALDVLDFYQQRWLNENYLRTATDTFSIMQLARAIGYELNPGLAATTWLAFTVDPTIGIATVAKGTQVQSLPTPSGPPQTFETLQDLTAAAAYNTLTPYQEMSNLPQPLDNGTQQLYLQGITTGLQIGGSILLIYNQQTVQKLCTLTQVQINASAGNTLIGWQENVGKVSTTKDFAVYAMRQQLGCFGNNAPAFQTVQNLYPPPPPANSPWNWDAINPAIWINPSVEGYATDYTDADLYLSQNLPKVLVGSWVVLRAIDGTMEAHTVSATNTRSLAGFGLTGRVTGLKLNGLTKNTAFKFRTTTLYVQSEALALYTQILPSKTSIQSKNNGIILNGIIGGLQPEQTLAISSLANKQTEIITIKKTFYDPTTHVLTLYLSASLTYLYQVGTISIYQDSTAPISVAISDPGINSQLSFISSSDNLVPPVQYTLEGTLALVSEVFTITGTQDINGHTVLSLSQDLQNTYNPTNSIIYGNVVEASHGATVQSEILGSGDGTQANQSFTLKRSPLTYLPAPNAQGSEDSLQIWVNNMLWQEVSSFYGQGSNVTCYVVRRDNDGTTHILFGDGQEGARLPTGQENVKATYRVGLGTVGAVPIGSLKLLQTRALGVKQVNNPLPATGAADPERGDAARQNAPRTVLTLDRIVSLTDMEYFVLAFPGIAKVQAAILSIPKQAPTFYLTVCGVNGEQIDQSSALYQNLVQAVNTIRTPGQSLTIGNCEQLPFNLNAQLTLDSNYLATEVRAQIEMQLLAQFGFDAMDMAQNVTAASIIDSIQSVPGVIAVSLTALYLNGTPNALPPQAQLPALSAHVSGNGISPAQLLVLNPNGINLTSPEV